MVLLVNTMRLEKNNIFIIIICGLLWCKVKINCHSSSDSTCTQSYSHCVSSGSLFAVCSTNQIFDSSTSGGDLYLEQGDIAQFEPPFLGSGWTVLCLANGARGTAPKPALEPINPFHQWVTSSMVLLIEAIVTHVYIVNMQYKTECVIYCGHNPIFPQMVSQIWCREHFSWWWETCLWLPSAVW